MTNLEDEVASLTGAFLEGFGVMCARASEDDEREMMAMVMSMLSDYSAEVYGEGGAAEIADDAKAGYESLRVMRAERRAACEEQGHRFSDRAVAAMSRLCGELSSVFDEMEGKDTVASGVSVSALMLGMLHAYIASAFPAEVAEEIKAYGQQEFIKIREGHARLNEEYGLS